MLLVLKDEQSDQQKDHVEDKALPFIFQKVLNSHKSIHYNEMLQHYYLILTRVLNPVIDKVLF